MDGSTGPKTAGSFPVAKEWVSETSRLQLSLPAPSVIVLTLRGHVPPSEDNLAYANALGAAVDRAGGQASVFFDLLELTGYDSELRRALTDALKPRAAQCRQIVVRAESRLVRMGVSVARLALPMLELVDRDSFEDRIADALKRAEDQAKT